MDAFAQLAGVTTYKGINNTFNITPLQFNHTPKITKFSREPKF